MHCGHVLCLHRSTRMAQGILNQMMADTALVEDLAKSAKDVALLYGVLMRTKEASNSAEVRQPSVLR